MRKRNLSYFLDSLFWFILLLMPLIIYIVANIETYTFSLMDIFTELSIPYDNFILKILMVFSDTVVLGDSSNMLVLSSYVNYMIIVELLHICVDLVLFIFKFAKKYLNKVVAHD